MGNLIKVSTWSGVDIHVDGEGRFYAVVDDIEIQEKTLEAVRPKIDKALAPTAKKVPLSLAVVLLLSDATEPFATTITGVSRTNREITYTPPLPKGGYRGSVKRILADTPKNRDLVSAYIAAEKAERVALDALRTRSFEIEGYGRIDIEAYNRIVASLTRAHAASRK